MSTKTDRDDKTKDDDGTDDKGGSDDAGNAGGAVTVADVERVVEDVVPRILDKLLGDDDTANNGGDDDDTAGGAAGGDGSPATNRAVEANVGAQVRAELDRIRREGEELDQKISAKVAEVVVERPPVKLSRFTRMIWGSDE